MSVDQRIREGLTMIGQQLASPDTDFAYDVVVQGAEERATRHRVVTGALGLAAASVVAVAALQYDVDISSGPAPTNPASQSPSGGSQALSLASVQGFWQAPSVSFGEMADNLREHGLGHWVGPLREDFTGQPASELLLHFNDSESRLRLDGAQIDFQTVRSEQGVLVLSATTAPGGRTRFTGMVEDGALKLTFLDTTERGFAGIPAKVYQIALYTTAPFEYLGD